MHYEIEASIYQNKQLSTVQRNSPFFTDCPVIGHHTIRSRTPLKFTELEMEKHEKDLKRLHAAHAIEIFQIDNDGDRMNVRELDKIREKARVETKATPSPVAPVVVAPVAAPEVKAEAAPEVVQPVVTPATVEPAAPAFDRKGKKGRRE